MFTCIFRSKTFLVEISESQSKVLTSTMMVSPRPFPYGSIGSLEIGLGHCLGWYLIVRPPRDSYPRRIIVKLGHAFQM